MTYIPYGFVQKPTGIFAEPQQNLLSNQKYISHIIDFGSFFMVQGEKGKRSNRDEDTGKRKAARYSSQNVLSGLLVCAECSTNYRRITCHSGEIVWRCANRVERAAKGFVSTPPSISEERIKEELCRRLEMDIYDEWKVRENVDTIFIREGGLLEIEYKKQEFSYNMRA